MLSFRQCSLKLELLPQLYYSEVSRAELYYRAEGKSRCCRGTIWRSSENICICLRVLIHTVMITWISMFSLVYYDCSRVIRWVKGLKSRFITFHLISACSPWPNDAKSSENLTQNQTKKWRITQPQLLFPSATLILPLNNAMWAELSTVSHKLVSFFIVEITISARKSLFQRWWRHHRFRRCCFWSLK